MVTPNILIIPGLIQKAITKDDKNLYTERKTKVLSENALQGAKLRLNVNKLLGIRTCPTPSNKDSTYTLELKS